jgi:hypothetical protein
LFYFPQSILLGCPLKQGSGFEEFPPNLSGLGWDLVYGSASLDSWLDLKQVLPVECQKALGMDGKIP